MIRTPFEVSFQCPQDEDLCKALVALAAIEKQWFSEKDTRIPTRMLSKLRYRGYLEGAAKPNRGQRYRCSYSLTDKGRRLARLAKTLLEP